MSLGEPSGPDIDGVVADANAAGLRYVVIGGFSVIANGYTIRVESVRENRIEAVRISGSVRSDA